MLAASEVQRVYAAMRRHTHAPAVGLFGAQRQSDTNTTPDGRFRFLVGVLLSSQTPDGRTALAVCRLDRFLPVAELSEELLADVGAMEHFDVSVVGDPDLHRLTIANVRASSEAALAELIRPVGFRNVKAARLKKIADELQDVPDTLQGLLRLPGVGHKMATLALRLCYGRIEGITVDTHVRRIAQRIGWAGSAAVGATPRRVQLQLEGAVPRECWGELNDVFVGFGQTFCKAARPNCAKCTLRGKCAWFQERPAATRRPAGE